MTYRTHIWSALSGDYAKLHTKTKRSVRDRLTKLYVYWGRVQ